MTYDAGDGCDRNSLSNRVCAAVLRLGCAQCRGAAGHRVDRLRPELAPAPAGASPQTAGATGSVSRRRSGLAGTPYASPVVGRDVCAGLIAPTREVAG